MDDTDLKSLCGAIFQTVIIGDIHIRVRYTGILINHISQYIQDEKYVRDPNSINSLKVTLSKIVLGMVVLKTGHLPDDKKRELQNEITQEFIKKFSPLDDWQSDKAILGTETLYEITQLNIARSKFNDALIEYSNAMAGSAAGFSGAMASIESIMTILSEICYRNDMIALNAAAWDKIIKTQTTAEKV